MSNDAPSDGDLSEMLDESGEEADSDVDDGNTMDDTATGETGGVADEEALMDDDDIDLTDAYDVNQWPPSAVVGANIPIRGQIAKTAKPKVRYASIAYECNRCGTITTIPQNSETKTEPYECQGCERQGPFVINRRRSTMLDYQIVRLQELPESSGGETGETIDIELYDELVDTVTPGDRIGMAADMTLDDEGKSVIAEVYGEATDIKPLEKDIEDIDIEPYMDDIEALSNGEHPDFPDASPFEVILASLAPEHEGDERVKEAIMFQLFSRGRDDGSLAATGGGTSRRNTLHVLLMGDPAIDKSGLLTRVRELMPRGVYTTGEGASSAGLTATATQDQFGGGGWTLEAGALVRANGGVACIDELDKMDSGDVNGVLECMSEQQVSVSKAGMNVTFPARTAILAAANPTEGRFDPTLKVNEQFGLSAPVRSRFDLTFVMQDDTDVEEDQAIVDRMTATMRVKQQREAGEDPDAELDDLVTGSLDDDFLRAYIRAAQEITPVLTPDARKKIGEDYVEIRNNGSDDGDSPPATPRAVGAVGTVAEASARIRLSDEITVEDVERATALHRTALIRMSEDDTLSADGMSGDGTAAITYDADLSSATDADADPTEMTRKYRLQYIQGIIQDLSDEALDSDSALEGAAIEDVIERATDDGLTESTVNNDIDKLVRQERIYQPLTGQYRVV